MRFWSIPYAYIPPFPKIQTLWTLSSEIGTLSPLYKS